MPFEVTFPAKPHHFEWFRIVRVVFLGFLAPAVCAPLFFELAAALISVGIRAGVHFYPFNSVERMGFAEAAHSFGVVLFAVSAGWAPRV